MLYVCRVPVLHFASADEAGEIVEMSSSKQINQTQIWQFGLPHLRSFTPFTLGFLPLAGVFLPLTENLVTKEEP